MAKNKTKQQSLPSKEQAWASDSVWSGAWEKYNPDTLIGRRGHTIYKRMMIDEQVKAVTHFKRDAITSREWYFELDDVAKESLGEEEQDFRIRL